MGTHRHEESMQDHQLALRGQRAETRIEVYLRLPPVHRQEIDFLIVQLQPTNCFSELKVLYQALRPLKMYAQFFDRGIKYVWEMEKKPFWTRVTHVDDIEQF